MKRSNRLVLLIGVFLAALVFVIVIVLLGPGQTSNGPEQSAPPSKIATVIASRDIALGVTITKDMLKTQDLEPNTRLPGAFGDTSAVIGSVTRAAVKSGQQVTAAIFTEQSGANFQCPAGFTCIAVQVDQLSGVGTLIKTGDYVDMVAGISPNFPILDSKTVARVPDENYDHTSVKVLLQGMQVVTTLLPPPPTAETGVATPAPGATAAPATGGGTALNGQQEIVILAVTPQQAEVIKFAQLDGSITLLLRSPKDFVDDQGNPIIPEVVKTTGIVLKTMITDYGVLPPKVITDPQPSAAP
ncbi:MAG: Flp pilus assembly protein CpaB [Chloroflexota bacterium]|nr:MAG: Flp pilus assembly protein CpaB [Chloroflexota bacterium]